MINEIKKDAQERMQKSLDSLNHAFGQIRTGKAHPSILGSVMVPYYGADTSITQVANITVKDSRTLQVVAFERNMLAAVDKAIQSAGLNLNPTNLGELLLISMPALTEETRKVFACRRLALALVLSRTPLVPASLTVDTTGRTSGQPAGSTAC